MLFLRLRQPYKKYIKTNYQSQILINTILNNKIEKQWWLKAKQRERERGTKVDLII